ncbi:type II toxin-antitoxin system Phd/YefM family antitoxin [Thiothrix litoralis]|jgi:prevent-host-death family protein|uniref:Antitoxin n=1 Tax=Thiothrix litoralis TaxID=2891210 RepID=A0ABX7WSK8_9GAMM|nr:type II toxin-antitoxin system Phd/YefM family antitoxin [Thiothrix litoralis]QTR46477.1 type II toxin-antitoxin system Phd/YefM family antitoxin [Thiothrix litoralis]
MQVTYSEARNNLATLLDKAVNEHQPITITRKNGKSAVLVDLDDYNALASYDPNWIEKELDKIAMEEGRR